MGNQQSGTANIKNDVQDINQCDSTNISIESISQETEQGLSIQKETTSHAPNAPKINSGPKDILSSAIANALSEYFLVDSSTIESNKITFRNVKLKPQISWIPLNNTRNATKITTIGDIEEVSFHWEWNVGGDLSWQWVKNATLIINKTRCRAQLEHVQSEDRPQSEDSSDDIKGHVDTSHTGSIPAQDNNSESWGLSGFVSRQVKMVIDTLTLQMIDFELFIELPSGLLNTAMFDSFYHIETKEKRSVVIGAKEIEILSHGRYGDQNKSDEKKLRQTIYFHSLVSKIRIEGGGGTTTVPLVEPFSYSAEMNRVGEQLDDFMDGLELFGFLHDNREEEESNEMKGGRKAGNHLTLHMGKLQSETFMKLCMMILPPFVIDTTQPSKNIMEETESVEVIYNGTPFMMSPTVNEKVIDIQYLKKIASPYLFDDTTFFIHGMQMK